jgi:Undecaprenyl-phosphate galactose phosphotransferase WbaP
LKRQSVKILMIILQFIFYFGVNKLFNVPDRIVYNTFFIYLILNLTKNMYSFKTILIWEELRKQLRVHTEYLIVMLINDIAFWGVKYIPVHLIIGITFTFFNILIIKIIRKQFVSLLEKRLLIIGVGNTARELTKIIGENNFTMYNLRGYISANNLLGVHQEVCIDKDKILGTYEEIEQVISDKGINEVIIAMPLADNKQMLEIINKLDGKVRNIKFIPQLNGVYTFNSKIEDYDGLMLVSTYNGMNRQINRFLKRGFDICAGMAGCLVLGILYLIYAPKIKKDGGKAIFYHTRIGKDLKPFKMYKFRSMYVDAEERLQEMLAKDEKIREEFYKNFKLKDDPRITEVGKFLRESSLDEFPQFINVLKGDMSFVGPRPIVQKEVEMYYGEKTSKKIFMVKPGITGMWQANGRSDVEDYNERIALDLYYIRNWSLWLDIIITIKTIKSLLDKRGAY